MATIDRTVGYAGASQDWDLVLRGSDDDLLLPVSIYVGEDGDPSDLIADIVELLRAYDFTDIQDFYQAPGSFYAHGRARFHNSDRNAARRNKKEMREELGGKRARTARRHEAIQKVQDSLWKRSKKKIWAAILAGSMFLGGVVGGAAKDALADELKDLAKQEAPLVIHNTKIEIREMDEKAAREFHRLVREHVEKSPEKTEVKVPPPSPFDK